MSSLESLSMFPNQSEEKEATTDSNEIKKSMTVKKAFELQVIALKNSLTPVSFDEKFMTNVFSELFKNRRSESLKDHFYTILWLYHETHRIYHNFNHIELMLKWFDIHEEDIKIYLKSYLPFKNHTSEQSLDEWLLCIKFIILFHDIVYEKNSHKNEFYSSLMAKNILFELGFEKHFINTVEKTILSTDYKNHLPSNPIEKVIRDLDFITFGFSWSGYKKHSQNVLAEVSSVSPVSPEKNVSYEQFLSIVPEENLKKRISFLTDLLRMESIYFTPVFRDEYEHIARANIQKEINLIGSIVLFNNP